MVSIGWHGRRFLPWFLERINCFVTEIWGLWWGVRIIVKEVPIKVKNLQSEVMLRLLLYAMLL